MLCLVSQTSSQLSERYGDVYSLRMGQKWMVVLNRFEVLKEALVTQGDGFADRPDLPLVDDVAHGQGVVFSNGNIWKQQRRFALSTLKYFGFGKKSLEPVILGKPFNPHLIINNAVSNVICSLVFGHRFDYGDEKFVKLMKWFDIALRIQVSLWAQGHIRHSPQIFERLDFTREELKKHEQNWDASDLRDYIDCYLNEIQTNEGKADSSFDEENLIMSVLDLFVAGSETTSTTLRWAFLYMAKYPEIQAKVQAEIDRVIGQSKQPFIEDHPSLPYTDSVIHEVQRISNIVPLLACPINTPPETSSWEATQSQRVLHYFPI
ncbi:cytochrome P450 2J2-like protein [Lates japonicus]|uniref:Cytochrome P450 2J2-like protein n=1 Tax=Lates japonicus TaxID=270547 RepID=A0AAD3MAA8_LATJO|nr:cytochrome P450 2J2-like protein [Lates japonicus]